MNDRTAPAWLTARPIAHRGLHDANRTVCENSPTAFRLATLHGFAIECDVHLSADRVPMVFHDTSLDRLTGDPRNLHEVSAADLGSLRLGTTDDTIPTLAALFDLVDGTVPIVVELKGLDAEADRDVMDRLAPVIESYRGPLALMSFDDWLVRGALDRFGSRVPVGLTAEGVTPEALQRHSVLFGGGCAFTSYNIRHLPNAFTNDVRETLGLPVLSWTVRTPDDVALSGRHADQMTFEGFMPAA